MKTINKHKKLIIGIIAVLLFIVVLILVVNKSILNFDNDIFDKFILKNRSESMTILMILISMICSFPILMGICLFTFLFKKNKKVPTLISLNLALVFLVNLIVKTIIQRPRPFCNITNEPGFSFPSAHSMVSMAFYGYIMYLVYKNVKPSGKKYVLCALLFALIILIGVSRIYLGAHFFSDVLGGFLLAICYLMVFITYSSNLYDALLKKQK